MSTAQILGYDLDDLDLPDDDSCLVWTGNCDEDGYGLKTYQGRQWRVHRLAFMLATGEDPGELDVLHSCDNPPCFRPLHLRTGTNDDNVADKVARGRAKNQYSDAEECIYGHSLVDESNVYINPTSGNRQCRTCRRLNNALDKKLAGAPLATKKVLREVFRERLVQHFRWDEQNHPPGTGSNKLFMIPVGRLRDMCKSARDLCNSRHKRGKGTWWDILAEEFFEYSECDDVAAERAELIQLAACCVARVEHIDRTAVEKA